jgi:hypothetical protein
MIEIRRRVVSAARALFASNLALGAGALLLGGVLLAGCAGTHVSPEAVAKTKTIGVISTVGDVLEYKQVSLMAFTNDQFTAPAAAFGLDAFIANTIRKDLGGRFDVRPVKYNAADFQDDKVDYSGGPFDSGEKPLAVIRGHATPNNLDAYLVIVPATGAVGNTNQNASGLGLIRQHRLLFHDYIAHAYFEIWVVDGHTGEKLGFEQFLVGDNVDESYWPFDSEQPSPAQAAKLADAVKKVIADGLPGALADLNLAPK